MRTIKLRNPDLPSKLPSQITPNQLQDNSASHSKLTANYSKLTERTVNLSKKVSPPSNPSPTITLPQVKRPWVADSNELETKPATKKIILTPQNLTPHPPSDHASKLKQFNKSESNKNLSYYGLVPGVIQELLKGAAVEIFVVQVCFFIWSYID